jgi:hypothetical protein
MFAWGWTAPLFIGIYTYLMLEIAAGKIAPVSENHAAPKRLLALALGMGAVVVAIVYDQEKAAMWMAASLLACGWVVLEALCERTVPVPSLYYSLARRGALGRLAGRVLYPGWSSGLLFAALLFAMIGSAIYLSASTGGTGWGSEDLAKFALVFPIACTAVVSPLLVLLLFPKLRQPMWVYILVQALGGLLFLMAAIVGGNTPRLERAEAYRWLAPFPTSAFFALMDELGDVFLRDFYTKVSLPACALIAGFLAIRAIREFKVISQLERACLQETSGSTPDSSDR